MELNPSSFATDHPVGTRTCIYCGTLNDQDHDIACPAGGEDEDVELYWAGDAAARDGDKCFAAKDSPFWCGHRARRYKNKQSRVWDARNPVV